MAAGAPGRMGVECDKLDYESRGHITGVILHQMVFLVKYKTMMVLQYWSVGESGVGICAGNLRYVDIALDHKASISI